MKDLTNLKEEGILSAKKGFTLIEIIIVMAIVGILAAVAIPSYTTAMIQGEAKAAQNNLIAIYNAQNTYFLNNGTSCFSPDGGVSPPCNSLAAINSALSLNLTDNNFTYNCNSGPYRYRCTATNIAIPALVIRIRYSPLVYVGGTGCTTPLTDTTNCNPYCIPWGAATAGVNTYCPN